MILKIIGDHIRCFR